MAEIRYVSSALPICEHCGRHPFPRLQSFYETTTQRNGRIGGSPGSPQSAAPYLARYIETAESQIAMARAALEAISTVIAPIQQLPDKLLARIFYIFASTTRTHSHRKSDTFTISPPINLFRITLVCKRWHDVIISHRSLWTTVYLPPWRYILDPRPQDLKLLEAQCQRAADWPLTLSNMRTGYSLTSGRILSPSPSIDMSVNPLLSSMRPYYPYFTKIELDIPSHAVGIFESHYTMPSLKHLRLCLTEAPGSHEPIDLTLLSYNFPNLTHIDLHLQCRVSWLSLPWSQLISFTIASLMTHEGMPETLMFNPFTNIHRLTRVEELDITFGPSIEPFDPQWSTVSLPQLRSLRLNKVNSAYNPLVMRLIRHLHAPRLQNLILDVPNPKKDHMHLHQILQYTPFSTLVTLKLFSWREISHHPTEILHVLHSLVNVETFSCFGGPGTTLTHVILLELSKPLHGGRSAHGSGVLFPLLKTLQLAPTPIKALDALEDVLRERVRRRGTETVIGDQGSLRTVFVVFADNSNGVKGPNNHGRNGRHRFTAAGRGAMRVATVTPPNYNDRTTDIKIRGKFSDDVLERIVRL